jgi:[NiFe] hydrogenase assembly HybE family chaperone
MGLIRHASDPSSAVESAYGRIWRDCMAGLPIVHPELSVQAVDFGPWQGHWLGIVVAPWCMSVLLVPGEAGEWTMPHGQQRRFVAFPFGSLAFLGSEAPELGEYQTCSLVSPMERFATQAEAVEAASVTLRALRAPTAPAKAPEPKASGAAAWRRRLLGLRQAGHH